MGLLKKLYDFVGVKKSSNNNFFRERRLDDFYINFEDRFRGSEKEVAERQKIYLPRLMKVSPLNKSPIVDIGCGRGEFLQLLEREKLPAIGVDINDEMIKRAGEKGLEVINSDAIKYLRNRRPNSISAITGFHIVEHIPFNDLLGLFEASFNSLKNGGIVIFETPNPENLVVGSCNFYNDPSHLKPIPPEVLKFALESIGFVDAEILRLHPIKKKLETSDPIVKEIAEKLFGPQDYAVIATKP